MKELPLRDMAAFGWDRRVAERPMNAAGDQTPENQAIELRAATEYVDRSVSGAKDGRPALDTLLKDARRRRFDVLVVWRLDRLGRNLRQLSRSGANIEVIFEAPRPQRE